MQEYVKSYGVIPTSTSDLDFDLQPGNVSGGYELAEVSDFDLQPSKVDEAIDLDL